MVCLIISLIYSVKSYLKNIINLIWVVDFVFSSRLARVNNSLKYEAVCLDFLTYCNDLTGEKFPIIVGERHQCFALACVLWGSFILYHGFLGTCSFLQGVPLIYKVQNYLWKRDISNNFSKRTFCFEFCASVFSVYSRDVGNIQKVEGGTYIQGHPHEQKLELFKLQRGTLPSYLWKVEGHVPPVIPRFLRLWFTHIRFIYIRCEHILCPSLFNLLVNNTPS